MRSIALYGVKKILGYCCRLSVKNIYREFIQITIVAI